MTAKRRASGRIGAAIAVCTAVCGTLDLTDALLFSKWRGVGPIRVLQYIASGAMGRAAFRGGTKTAALGVLIHFVIAASWVTLFVLLARWTGFLRRHAVVWGAVYGLLMYAVMNYVVLPQTRLAAHGRPSLLSLVNGMAALVFCFGVPLALLSRRYLR